MSKDKAKKLLDKRDKIYRTVQDFRVDDETCRKAILEMQEINKQLKRLGYDN